MKEEMKNQTKALMFLTLCLGICSGTLLVNRFVIEIPDWLAIVFIVFAAISLFMCVYYYFRKNNQINKSN